MKKLWILALSLFTVAFSHSQTIEDAKSHLYHERNESAKNILQQVVAKGDQSPEALYWLAETYFRQNKPDSAKAALLTGGGGFLQKEFSKKESPLLYIGWAHLLLDSGKTAEARKQLEFVLDETKYKDAEALLAAGKANIDSKNGDTKWAIELLEQAAKRDKKNPVIYTTLGDAYRKLVDGSNAVINYDKALNAESSFAEAHYKKGKIYKTQNNPDIYLELFNKALAADSTYTPALYEMYFHYFSRDVVNAKKYLDQYIRHSDPDPQHGYMETDLHYVSQKYKEAIAGAKNIIQAEGKNVQPRLYKLLAYSYAATGDSATALENINVYFDRQDSIDFVAKDYALKASLLETMSPDKSVAIEWYRKAMSLEKDEKEKLGYIISLADLQKDAGNRQREAMWREQIYQKKDQPTNLDLYKWGMALYSGKDYPKADSVFAIYEEKYPDQLHGPLWRARANALIDSTMEKGLAVVHYKKLVDIASADTVKNKAVLLTAYDYLGGYEATITKNFEASLEYFTKLLQLDPDNTDANKNTALLRKWIDDGKGSANN